MPASWGGGGLPPVGLCGIPACTEADPPPLFLNRITDTNRIKEVSIDWALPESFLCRFAIGFLNFEVPLHFFISS